MGRSVRRGGHAWVDEVDEMMSRYFCCLVRDEMKMERHSFIGYRPIQTYSCLSIFYFLVICSIVNSNIMSKFTIIGRFGDISLDELSELQGEFVRLFRRFPAASVT